MFPLIRLCVNRVVSRELNGLPSRSSFYQSRCLSILTSYQLTDHHQNDLRANKVDSNQSLLNLPVNGFSLQKRFKKKGKKKGRDEREVDSDKEEEEEEDDDDDDEQDDIVGGGFRDLEIETTNMRLDVVMKSGMPMLRKKIDEAHAEDRIRVNGERVTKKSMEVGERDEIDYIYGRNRENSKLLDIRRVVVLAVPDTKTAKDRSKFKIRRFQSLTIENYVVHPYESMVLNEPEPEKEPRKRPEKRRGDD